jgi:hypothetical protein
VIQEIEGVRTELKVLLSPNRKGLEERHVDSVVAGTIQRVLKAEELDCCCGVANWPLEEYRYAVRVDRADWMGGVRDRLA